MDEPTLHLVEEAVASRASASGSQPIGSELFPRLDQARTLDEAEKVIHDAGQSLAWLGDALVADALREPLLRDAIERAVPQMLAIQDGLERVLDSAVGKLVARKVLVAHETLRRFFAVCARTPRSEPRELPDAAKPSTEYMRGFAMR